MFSVRNRLLAFILTLSILIGLAGCAQTGTPAPATQPAATTAGAPAQESVTLRIALLPVLDALPMYVAQQEGLFTTQGIKVEFIPVASAPERDQLIAAGQADGMINEAVSVMVNNKNEVRVQIVRYARAATSDSPLFHILASGKSEIQDIPGLKGVEIGISTGTVIEYLTDRLLEAEGFQPGEIKKVAVPKIPDRMALLASGQLKAAMLPDPTFALSMQQGAREIINDSRHPEYSFSTITFRKAVIDQHPEAIRAFLKAIEDATTLINADQSKWGDVLAQQKLVPPQLLKDFKSPRFVTAGVPSEQQWNDCLDWAKKMKLVTTDVPYATSVNPQFLPK